MKQAIFSLPAYFISFGMLISMNVFISTAFAHPAESGMPDGVAEMEYLILLEFEPGNIELRNRLGMIYYRQNKLEKAVAQFAEVFRTAPDDFDALDGMGLVLTREKKFTSAISHFIRAISKKPTDVMVYFHLGRVYEETGNLTEAEKAYQTALGNCRKGAVVSEKDETTAIIIAALKRVAKIITLSH